MSGLNPQENVWQFMRDNWLSNRIFKSFDDIVDHCCDAWNKLIDQPWRIMSIGLRDWVYASCSPSLGISLDFRVWRESCAVAVEIGKIISVECGFYSVCVPLHINICRFARAALVHDGERDDFTADVVLAPLLAPKHSQNAVPRPARRRGALTNQTAHSPHTRNAAPPIPSGRACA